MADNWSPEQKIDLIKQNLQEVLNPEILDDVIGKQKRPLKIYWGTAPTGRPHCGYFVPMLKIADFLRAGCAVKILLADLHAFLDDPKGTPWDIVKLRAEYYRHAITALLRAVDVPIDRLEFVLGSSYQLSSAYTFDLLRIFQFVSDHDAKKAGAEVVKQTASPMMSSMTYPVMQALDEQHLGVDAQFGGVDQRKIFGLAVENLPKIGYQIRAHLMNPMVPGLAGGKMSASDPRSKIDLLDPPEVVKNKIRKAYAAPREVDGNGLISLVEYVLLPASALKSDGNGSFPVERNEEEGGLVTYHDIDSLKEDYRADKVTPQALKAAVTAALLTLMASIQEEFQASSTWQDVEKKAYAPPVVEKKAKKVKDKGTRHPGASEAAKEVNGVDSTP
ncbi:MAG: Mitochondrial intermediate peptidase [Watsoniomyces obsoletus]|nr:MAG: Mitochondrial intermediate peptidase [Watsoniomyces obsoletus]